MKEKFLELVNEVKETGIAEAVYKTTSAEELKEVWQKFLSENPDLITKIGEWAEEFKKDQSAEIFECGELIENPMEIAIVILIIDDVEQVSEAEIFEDCDELAEALEEIDNNIAKQITEFVQSKYICNITAEDIFPEDDDSGEDEEN